MCSDPIPWASLTSLSSQDYFDFIHMRNICHSIKDWSSLLKQAKKYEYWRSLGPNVS